MTRDLYIGLMSGTSADGIDAALVEFKQHDFQIIGKASTALPADIREAINRLCSTDSDEIHRAAQLGIQLSHLNASLVNKLLSDIALSANEIRAIGYHGQTIRHHPDAPYPYSVQIGCPSTLAFNTGISTVTDFRMADISAAGQGAPLVPAFHEFAFRSPTTDRFIINIGGIANVTFLPGNVNMHVTGFDTGPGNTLMDAWIQLNKDLNMDINGAWASTGTVIPCLLEAMMMDRYIQKLIPKSTGKEHFNLDWLHQHLTAVTQFKPEDIQRTLLQFTANSIATHIKLIKQKFDSSISEIYVCGGGINNTLLMQSIQEQLPQDKIFSTAALGLDPQLVECSAFAWLARQTMNKQPGNLTSVTGASQQRILGGIYLS
jgi:anhydro-N-acetylmuramic acid kinase